MKCISLSLIGAIALTGACFAQSPDPFDLAVGNVLILQVKSVQKEVGLSESQRSKLNVFATAFNKKKDAFLKDERAREQKQGKSFKPNEAKMRDMFSEFRGQVLGQLSAKQVKRLRELTLQEVGMASMLDANVARKMGISSGQTAKLRAAYEDGAKRSSVVQQLAVEPIQKEFKDKDPNDKKNRDLFNQRMAAAEKKTKPQLDKIKIETRSKFRSILTASQLAQWQTLTGTPFKG